MDERHIKVSRTARYFILGAINSDTRQLWLVCHGYRQLARRFLDRFQKLDDGSRVIVAPEGLSRFYLEENGVRESDKIGATWMTREDRMNEIRDYIGYLDEVLENVQEGLAEPLESLIVLGFSQGVHTACRWVIAGDMPVKYLICWGAYPPDDLDLERGPGRLADSGLILVRGLSDRRAMEESHHMQEERLFKMNVPFRTLTHPGGHDLDAGLLQNLAG